MSKEEQKDNFRLAPKNQLLAALGVFLAGTIICWTVLGVIFVKAADFFGPAKATQEQAVQEKKDDSPTKARLLDGRIVAKEDYNLLPIGIMIENISSARPQSGLSRASVVYETVAEGFITRFLVVFDPKEMPDKIGPVRSARPYYIDWLREYDGLYAHAGGSPEALRAVDGLGVKDLNALYNGQYFWRDTGRSAPHNLYTSEELIVRALRDFEFADDRADFEPWKFKDDAEELPIAGQNVSISFYGAAYEASYIWERETNEYLRENGGYAHEDANTGEQIRVKNIIVQQLPPVLDVGEKGRLTLDVAGEGRCLVARDGQVIEGVWKKPTSGDRTRFYDQNNQEIELNRGSTWVHLFPDDEWLVEVVGQE